MTLSKKTMEEIKNDIGTKQQSERIKNLSQKILDCCRTGEYSIYEIECAMTKVKDILREIPLN